MRLRPLLAKQFFCAVVLAPLTLLGCASVPRAGGENHAQAETALQPRTRFGAFAPGPAACAVAARADSLKQCLEFERFLLENCVGRLSYAQQRWMIPQLGRFASEDPVGVTAGRLRAVGELNGFGYVGGNPLRWVDPQGLVRWNKAASRYELEADDTPLTLIEFARGTDTDAGGCKASQLDGQDVRDANPGLMQEWAFSKESMEGTPVKVPVNQTVLGAWQDEGGVSKSGVICSKALKGRRISAHVREQMNNLSAIAFSPTSAVYAAAGRTDSAGIQANATAWAAGAAVTGFGQQPGAASKSAADKALPNSVRYDPDYWWRGGSEPDRTWGVDPAMRAADEEAGVIVEGRYIRNPTARNLRSILTASGKVGSKEMSGQYMYVIDSDGNIVIGTRSGQRMPHPTLVGGAEPNVKGAGIVDIRGGRIYSVNNSSGHFKPGPEALHAARKAFETLPSGAFHPNFKGYIGYGE